MTRELRSLITGSSSGFGRATAVTLARAGHRVFAGMRAIASKNAGPASELEELAAREGLALRVIELDVTSDASVDAGVARALDEAGGVDVVINNAGVLSQGRQGPPDPQQVADAILKLTELPAGERPLRTVLDPLGNGAAEEINRRTEDVQRAYIEWMGLGGVLRRAGG
ncbi:SDR family NAD(P)-dependent oxidoreductase [Sorangium sp. So ce448]|uniref:SDR family NAD(P)-dependent oxidoreductase n=1 Tax=Sorangium sp. So ce448 TaxID=3133314 RepID=UPI003F616859